jgi:hypothetical protein
LSFHKRRLSLIEKIKHRPPFLRLPDILRGLRVQVTNALYKLKIPFKILLETPQQLLALVGYLELLLLRSLFRQFLFFQDDVLLVVALSLCIFRIQVLLLFPFFFIKI